MNPNNCFNGFGEVSALGILRELQKPGPHRFPKGMGETIDRDYLEAMNKSKKTKKRYASNR